MRVPQSLGVMAICDLANAAARQLFVTTAGCVSEGAFEPAHSRQIFCIGSIALGLAT
jgi:hypothetical protein